MSSKPASTVDELSKLLKQFDIDVLKTMMKGAKIDYKKDEEISDDLIDWSYEQGIKKFVEKLDEKTLQSSMKEASVEVGEATSLEALGEKFLDSVEQDSNGPEGFLSKMKISTLKNFAKLLNFETDAVDSKQFAEDIADQLLLDGTMLILEHLSVNDLKNTCEKVGVTVKKGDSKSRLMELVLSKVFNGLNQEDEEEEEEPKKEKKEKKEKKDTKKKEKTTKKDTKKKDTKKKDTKKDAKNKREEEAQKIKDNRPSLEDCKEYDDIFQNYWAQEIKEFCKKNGINTQGNKKDLIKRILDFNEDPENKGFVTKKRKRKSTSSAKNKKKKESSDTNGAEESKEEAKDE